MTPKEVSHLLFAWRNGDPEAFDKLMPMVYDELRCLAHRYMKRVAAGQTLQTTALVHEAYLRLAGREDVDWQGRAHFFAVCAQVMRNLLVDRARARPAHTSTDDERRGRVELRAFNRGREATVLNDHRHVVDRATVVM